MHAFSYKILFTSILTGFFLLVSPQLVKACTYQATITGNHVNFTITSDTDKLAVVQYIRRSGSALVTKMYGAEIGSPWTYYDDPNCNIYINDPVGCRQIRWGTVGEGAFWQWYDWTLGQYFPLPASGWGMDFDSPPTYDSLGIEYGVIPGTTGEAWTWCTRTGDVQTPTPTPLPNLDVLDIKQYSTPWNNDIYDHANLWSVNPTIQRWGCALTAAAMVLRYFGHDIWPNSLNEWLKTQPDGYLRNGLLNWLAVSRYTRLNDSTISPTLLYRRLPADNTNLINELTQGGPSILKEPGHYVVAKSQLSDSFGINDPAYADRTTLAPYGNSFSAIGSYQPTHSDLSYILLTVDGDIALKVFDPQGNEVQGSFFIDEPLADDAGGPETSGEPLGIFLFPEPPGGIYKIEVSGPTSTYTLNSYLYNEEGEVTQSSINGLISEGKKDEFAITINETSGIEQEISIDSIIQDLDSAWTQGLIRNRVFYKALRRELTTVKKLLFFHQDRTAKRILISVLRQIKAATPLLIDPAASQILQRNVQILIGSL